MPDPVASHLFENSPDARQSSEQIVSSRFRPRYMEVLATADKIKQHDKLTAKAAELEALIESFGPTRYTSLALTALEESVMWAIKELTT